MYIGFCFTYPWETPRPSFPFSAATPNYLSENSETESRNSFEFGIYRLAIASAAIVETNLIRICIAYLNKVVFVLRYSSKDSELCFGRFNYSKIF